MAKVVAEVGSTANKYEILAKLATGGMADIFLAKGESAAGVERYCVLKRIIRDRAGDAQFVQMFLDEARLAAQLQHPNIASVYDVGKLGNSYFFTMEYVHGETVRSLLDRSIKWGRPVPLACALTIVAGAAAGLHHAHQRNGIDGRALGIVHRDVSPANLMVSYEGNVKVVDFGVAKAAHRTIETRSGTVKGKISYLSPEQCRGERVDRRSDLFSLGIVMWELLTGERMYRRQSDYANMTAIVGEKAVPPSVCRPDVSREVDAIVLQLLAKDAEHRFQRADEVVDRIETVAVRAGIMVSTSAVSRFMRELFGQRPEPWLELSSKAVPREPSLSGGAASPGPSLSMAEMIDIELANIVELSAGSGVIEIDEGDEPPDTAAVKATPLPPSAAPTVTFLSSAGQPIITPPPSPPANDTIATSAVAARRSPVWLRASLLGGAAVAGLLAVWFATQVGAGTPLDAATPDAGPPDAAARDAATPDAATPDAAPPDAAPPDATPPDAATRPDPRAELLGLIRNGESATVVVICSARVTDPIADVCVRAACMEGNEQLRDSWSTYVTSRRLRTAVDAFCEQEFQKRAPAVLDGCGGATNEARAPNCTRAACRTRATDTAIRWVRRIPETARASLIALCQKYGIDVSKQPDCTKVPADCP